MPTTHAPTDVCHVVNASALMVGDIVTNLGIVNAVRHEGVFIVANVRGDVWSLASGTCHTASLDVVWHQTQEVVVGMSILDLCQRVELQERTVGHAI